jgi:hypothetical protein
VANLIPEKDYPKTGLNFQTEVTVRDQLAAETLEKKMNIKNAAVLIALALAGCVTSGPSADLLKSAERRELTLTEKASLTLSLSQTLKDPGSAQFKWLPVVVLMRDGITDYCGFVNGRNSYGGYTGFQKFYAQLIKNPKGDFSSGVIRLIASDDVMTIAANGACDGYGYTDAS